MFVKPAGYPQSVADGLFGLFIEEVNLRIVDNDIDVVARTGGGGRLDTGGEAEALSLIHI